MDDTNTNDGSYGAAVRLALLDLIDADPRTLSEIAEAAGYAANHYTRKLNRPDGSARGLHFRDVDDLLAVLKVERTVFADTLRPYLAVDDVTDRAKDDRNS